MSIGKSMLGSSVHPMSVDGRTESLTSLLKFGGIWLNFSHRSDGIYLTAVQILRYCYMAVGWLLVCNLLLYRGIGFLLKPTAVFIPLGMNIVFTTALMLFRAKEIEMVIRESEKNLQSYRIVWEKKVLESDARVVVYLGRLIKYSLLGFGLSYMILPAFLDLARAVMGYTEPYIVPLPFDGYIDKVEQRSLTLYLIVLASDLWYMLGIPSTIAFESYIFYVISYTTSEIKILKKHLRSLCKDENGVELMKDWDLRNIIRKHQRLIRLNGYQRKYLTLPYMCQWVVSAISFCFTMFLIKETIGKDSFVTVLSCIFIVMLLAIVSVMCYTGEYLEGKSEELFYEIYSIPWYRQSPKVRNHILLLLMESSRPLVLDYRFHFTLNLRAYMQIINTAYSYYMLMESAS